ncbi:hypothetical protein R3P38DRAFT_3225226 [Favolaschia claudopus]|uniref:Uncharacterized protein n=1 Tax=Favolaschia claudopus TaxID=2862362 RepID=A0AAV9ZVY7_9AGAR
MSSQSNSRKARRDENRPAQDQSKDVRPSRSQPTRRPLQDANTGNTEGVDDAGRIRELENALAESQAECAELRNQQPARQPSNPTADSETVIPRPVNISTVKMSELRAELGFNRSQWNALRSCVRYAMAAARLDWTKAWKNQEPKKKLRFLNVVRADFPETQRFENGWGIIRIAQEAWGNRKSYGRCVDDPNTYRGRKTVERRGRRDDSPSPAPSNRSQRTRASSSRVSQSPGPTIPQRQPAPSSDDDDDDDLYNFSDDGQREEGSGGPARKKARS